MESKRGTVGAEDVEGTAELVSWANDGAVVEEEGKETEPGTVFLDAEQEGLEDQGKEEGGERVALLRSSGADDALFPEKEERWSSVAILGEGRGFGAVTADLLQHGLPANAVASHRRRG